MGLRSEENLIIKRRLREKVDLLHQVLKSSYPFGLVTREENPPEYFAAMVIKKLYSLQISMENVLLCNDVQFSIYLFRYVYELHRKVRYIVAGTNMQETLNRLDNFFSYCWWNQFRKHSLLGEFSADRFLIVRK